MPKKEKLLLDLLIDNCNKTTFTSEIVEVIYKDKEVSNDAIRTAINYWKRDNKNYPGTRLQNF